MAKVIAIDAGHGIETYPLTGGKGVPEMAEFEFNSAVAGYAKQYLEDAGYEIVFTQPLVGKSNSLQKRLQIAKESKVDFLISIHADYNQDPKPHGHWIFFWHENDTGKKFAEAWSKIAREKFPHPARGTRSCRPDDWCNFFMVREPHKADIPAVLIEHGFMSNAEDLKILMTDEFRRLAAEAIAEATIEVIGNPDWRLLIGNKALWELHQKNLLNNPEKWAKSLLEPLPAWVIWEMFNRTTNREESP